MISTWHRNQFKQCGKTTPLNHDRLDTLTDWDVERDGSSFITLLYRVAVSSTFYSQTRHHFFNSSSHKSLVKLFFHLNFGLSHLLLPFIYIAITFLQTLSSQFLLTYTNHCILFSCSSGTSATFTISLSVTSFIMSTVDFSHFFLSYLWESTQYSQIKESCNAFT